MTNNQETEKAERNHYSEEFKQALLRSVKDGVAVAGHCQVEIDVTDSWLS